MSIGETSLIETPAIAIREIELLSEMHEAETLQKDVWGCDDLDVIPVTLFVASKQVGAVLIGAYDGASLVGFVYGFPGFENGHVTHHSHMLAVRSAYRNHNLGYKLKLAQRERVLGQGVSRITWTFDPLQSLNAYFNFGKLGVVADSYKINFYGEATSSFLHQIGTDRLWVTWLIDTQHVRERLQRQRDKEESLGQPEGIACLVQVDAEGAPQRNTSLLNSGEKYLSIQIPPDINSLQMDKPEMAVAWRDATRWAFTSAIECGYLVESFYVPADRAVGVYLLTYDKKISDFK